MANSIYDYFNDQELWDRNIRPLDDPKLRVGTPRKLKSPFGSMELTTEFTIPSRKLWRGGDLIRFSYHSIEEDGSEHDPHPFIILMDRPEAGGTIRYSDIKDKEGLRYFTGLNLNYLEAEAMTLLIDAVAIQEVTRGPVTYEAMMAVDSLIPYHAFRMYYIKTASNFKKVNVERI